MATLSDNTLTDSSNVENEDFSSRNLKTSLEPQNELTQDTSRMQDSFDDHEDESAILVLDPDHPKMVQFQAAVKKYLLKMKEKHEMSIREVDKPLKMKTQEKESLGVDLYGVQQELARQQMLLESAQDKYINLSNERMKNEAELDMKKNNFTKLFSEYNKCKKQVAQLQNEIENLGLRRFYMRDTKDDLGGDIKLLKRAADKAENDVLQAQVEKKKQDLFVDRLVEKVEKLQDDIAMFNAQYKLQVLETKNAKNLLHEAELQLMSINLEKRELQQYWRNSLIGMKRRDEAYMSTLSALRQLEEDDLTLDTDIIGYKKSILSEQEQNEKLTNIYNKNKKDADIVKEMLKQCRNKHETLKTRFSTHSRLLHETEKDLNKTNMEKNYLSDSLEEMKKMTHKEKMKMKQLENAIMEKIHSQLMFEKSSQYTNKLTDKTKEISQQLDFERIMLENVISRICMEFTSTKARKTCVENVLKQYDEEIVERNEVIDRSEQGILKRASLLQKKQTTIDICNKKLEVLINKAGGIELGPLEATVKSLQKSIKEREHDIGQLQQTWLQKQGILVQLIKERDVQSEIMETTKKEHTVHSQKKIRTENKIHKQECEKADLERSLSNCRNDIIKLNTLNHQENQLAENSEQNNILVENNFLLSLQQAKIDLIDLEEKLQNQKNEKEILLQNLVETDQQIMLWERKIQLLKETRAAVDTDFDQGEIKSMKAEIHRMEVRYAQLIRQQNKMIQETERFFLRRDSIVVQGEARLNKKVFTKGALTRQLTDLKKRIKQSAQEANRFNLEIENLQKKQNIFGEKLDSVQEGCIMLKSQVEIIEDEIKSKVNSKYKDLLLLVAEQQKSKYFQQVKEDKYKFLYKKKLSRHTEFKKQVNRIQALLAIVEQMNQEYPRLQFSLAKVALTLRDLCKKYLSNEEEEEEELEEMTEEEEETVEEEEETVEEEKGQV